MHMQAHTRTFICTHTYAYERICRLGLGQGLGAYAYSNDDRFPTGPYCQVGDWVVFRAFSGTRIKIQGKEFRLINDDTVEAVVEDPRGVERA